MWLSNWTGWRGRYLRLCAHGRRFRAFSKTFSSLLSFWRPVYTDQGKILSMYWISSNFCSKLLVFASVFAWKHKWKRSKTLPCARSLSEEALVCDKVRARHTQDLPRLSPEQNIIRAKNLPRKVIKPELENRRCFNVIQDRTTLKTHGYLCARPRQCESCLHDYSPFVLPPSWIAASLLTQMPQAWKKWIRNADRGSEISHFLHTFAATNTSDTIADDVDQFN